jgi:hypothetical protein
LANTALGLSVLKYLAQRLVHFPEQQSRICRLFSELLLQRPKHGRYQRRTHPVPHHIANKDAQRGVRNPGDVKTVAPDKMRCPVVAAHPHRALLLRHPGGHRWETARQQRLLEFVRHPEVLLHELVFFA